MTPEFNRWWDADELSQTNPYEEGTPVFWAWEGWYAKYRAKVDCTQCANRDQINGATKESHCSGCKWQEKERTDEFVPKDPIWELNLPFVLGG